MDPVYSAVNLEALQYDCQLLKIKWGFPVLIETLIYTNYYDCKDQVFSG